MRNQLGITQWTVPWKDKELCKRAENMGLSTVHLDLGSVAKGYPMMNLETQEIWLEQTQEHHLRIVSLALNDLCNNGFMGGIGNSKSEIAVSTMEKGIETARRMNIPSVSVPHFYDNRIKNEADLSIAAEALRFLCDMAAEQGILVYTENVLGKENLERLWGMVNRENLRLLFDTQNYAAMGNVDATEIFLAWQSLCGTYVHLKDGDGALGNRTLGKGRSDFDRILSVLLRCEYTGAMILESNYTDQETLEADISLLQRK